MPHDYPNQVLCEALKVRIISKHILMLLPKCLFRIDPWLEIPLLGVIGMDEVVVGDGETWLHDEVDVYLWRVEKLGNVLVSLLLVVLTLIPSLDRFAIPLQHNEVGIQEQDDIFLHLLLIQRHWNRLSALVFKRIGKEGRLDHWETVNHILTVHATALEERLIQTYSESIHEVAPT